MVQPLASITGNLAVGEVAFCRNLFLYILQPEKVLLGIISSGNLED